MKRLLNIMVAVSVITIGFISINVFAGADTPIVKMDGRKIEFPDAKPYVNEDNRTMVPVRFVSEALGCIVEWEESRELVIISKAENRILLHIGDNSAIVNTKASDVRKEFDTKAVLKNDRTMVPLRFISETLGVGVAWDEASNTVILRSDGTVEAVATPTPAVTPAPKATPTPVITPTPSIPTPTGTPSPKNIIPGNPYYVNGLNGKEDLKRFIRLQDLFKYDDITSISGDDNNKDLGRVGVGYGTWNPYQKRYQAYLNVNARESDNSFNISISKYGEKEIQRLREIINIAVIGDQDYKDFVYNTVISCKNGFTGGIVQYTDGSNLYVSYDTGSAYNAIWGDDAFFVTVWR